MTTYVIRNFDVQGVAWFVDHAKGATRDRTLALTFDTLELARAACPDHTWIAMDYNTAIVVDAPAPAAVPAKPVAPPVRQQPPRSDNNGLGVYASPSVPILPPQGDKLPIPF